MRSSKTACLLLLSAVMTGCETGVESSVIDETDAGPCARTLTAMGVTERSVVSTGTTVLQVELVSCAGPVSAAPIRFAILGDPIGAQLSASQLATDAAGSAVVTLTAGGPGTLSVEASNGGLHVYFDVEVEGAAACNGHCTNSVQDCGETGFDCGGECGACTDSCANHCTNSVQDCGETGLNCGGECGACSDPCTGHCTNSVQDCGETGLNCGGGCGACPDACANHCISGAQDCGEAGADCGGAGCGECAGTDNAEVVTHSLPAAMACSSTVTATVTLRNSGTRGWYTDGSWGYKLGFVGDNSNPFLPGAGQTRAFLAEGQTVAPGANATFTVTLRAPDFASTATARFQMVLEGVAWFGQVASRDISVTCGGGSTSSGGTSSSGGGTSSGGAGGGCSFPQGVPDGDFTNGSDTNAGIAGAVNNVMVNLSGCNIGSDCYIGDRYDSQAWFAAVAQALRDQGYCAGQHEVGHTDEIAVSNGGCTGRWYGYHIFNYGGSKVVWNPGAQRGWWSITPNWCQ